MINFNPPKHLTIGIHFNDPSAPPPQQSMQDILQAFQQNIPGIMSATNSQVVPTAQANLAADKAVSPGEDQLMTQLYQQFAPQLAATGSQIDTANRNATANTDVSILGDQGAKLASEYQTIDKSLNPEYYQVRSQAAKSLGDVLNAASLDKPNIEAERLLNQENQRTGNAVTPSATNTVSNALNFEDQRQKRISNLSNAISTATSFLQPATNSQFNPATTALNKPTSSTGLSNFNGVTSGTGSAAYSTGSNLLNSATGLQQSAMDINANRRDVLDRINGVTSSINA